MVKATATVTTQRPRNDRSRSRTFGDLLESVLTFSNQGCARIKRIIYEKEACLNEIGLKNLMQREI